MKQSIGRILTTHAGSLPRPEDLMKLYRDDAPDIKLQPHLQSAVTDVVRRQSALGIDIVNDGEFGKAMRRALDFGAWWSYVYDRLAGFEVRTETAEKGRAAWTFGSKERKEFAEGGQKEYLRYFSFYVIKDKTHEREIETLLIHAAGSLLTFNQRKKVDLGAPSKILDYEPGTNFYERQRKRGPQ